MVHLYLCLAEHHDTARAFKCFELILGKMYTIITNFSVKLTEIDVPGAELL